MTKIKGQGYGGGPLFGGGNQSMNANAMPSEEEMKKQLDEIQANMPKQFKQRF